MTTSPRLIVALHDVAPPFQSAVSRQLEALERIGVTRCVLNVVPNWHGVFPISQYPSFVDMVRREVIRGGEIVLHGLTHQARGPRRGTFPLRIRGTLFASDAAEFLSLSTPQCRAATTEGIEAVAAVGLPRPTSFCAPGWLLPATHRTVLRDTGIRLVTGMFSVWDLSRTRIHPLASIGYMGAGTRQEFGIALLNTVVQRAWIPSGTTVGIYLHPQEGNQRALVRVLAAARDLIQRGWQPGTFAEVFQHG